ncbi:putative spermidine/putrescine transport system permease protein [Anaerovirgula multivorans]|uniref:Putative spermidine/putrescine transport system permease protein n=1 Tax=Anaerovirgula multivorans TaxID=312168 RepID=A0A239HQR5_9FIRM|nr:ABC transporter permease subunit [Anaerovirgula multivorans]SNS83669.1 putative spermidine/putrescine transport system permease protein [Anaerovirgula multivorans]
MKKTIKPYIMLLPAMTILLGIFVAGLSMAFLQSLGYFPTIGLQEFTLNYYKEVLTDHGFLTSLRFSLWIAFVSSSVSVVLGVLLAYSIVKSKHKKGLEEIVYKLPVIVPHVVATLLVYNILGQSGIIARMAYALGFISQQSEFPALLFDKNGFGIILAYVWKGTPFIAMVVYTVLSNMNNRLSEVALNLGATNKQVFWHVLIPLTMPSIFSSFIIIFAFSFGAYEVPFLIGPTAPRALPVQAYAEYMNADLRHRPYTMTINMVLTFISFLCIWIYHKTFKLLNKYNG